MEAVASEEAEDAAGAEPVAGGVPSKHGARRSSRWVVVAGASFAAVRWPAIYDLVGGGPGGGAAASWGWGWGWGWVTDTGLRGTNINLRRTS